MRIAEETIISGTRAIAKSYAKINLTLDVLSRMENGYHEIETIMQTVGLFDLVVTDRTEKNIVVNTNLSYLPTNEKNIAYKACDLFFKESKIDGGAKVLIHKNIPVAAGLAGGSGNAAAVLSSLNLLYDKPFADKELLELGAKLGADVPFCMMCGTVHCGGIGDILTPISPLPKKYVLLVKPPVSISTAEIYESIDNEPVPPHPKTSELVSSIEKGECDLGLMFNVMEQVSVKKYPVINGIREKLLLNGASAAMMSGSGSTVFGIFEDYETAKKSQDSFSHLYKDVYLTMTN